MGSHLMGNITTAERAFRRDMAAYDLKWCSGCAAFLPIGMFGRDKRKPDGMAARCLGCYARYRDDRRDDPDYRAKRRERCARYYRKHPDVFRAQNRLRRARLAAAESRPYNEADIYAAYDYACVFCGDEATAIEHFIPIALGGPDVPENLLIACTSCNSSKGAKSPLVWLREARGITFDAVCVAA